MQKKQNNNATNVQNVDSFLSVPETHTTLRSSVSKAGFKVDTSTEA